MLVPKLGLNYEKITRLKYFNAAVHHLTFHTFDKYGTRQQLHKCTHAIKFKILGQRLPYISFCLIFMSYDKQYHMSSESNHSSAVCLEYNKCKCDFNTTVQ